MNKQVKIVIRWLHITKYYKGGSSETYICLGAPDVKEDWMLHGNEDEKDTMIEEIAKDWGEKSNGGHNYGWKIDWKIILHKDVPNKAIQKFKKSYLDRIERHEAEVKKASVAYNWVGNL